LQESLDQIFKPLEDLLVEAFSLGPGGRVLDVGCGAGGRTLVARELGARGRRFGIDISDAMIAARSRTRREGTTATFICANAQTAAPLLPNLPARQTDAPGQFASANGDRVHNILKESGWADIDIRPISDRKGVDPSQLGPVGRIIQETDDQTRIHVIQAVRAVFDPYVHGAEVRFTAACWMVRAQARSASVPPESVG
jgi:SAM-dependent methyltransferase